MENRDFTPHPHEEGDQSVLNRHQTCSSSAHSAVQWTLPLLFATPYLIAALINIRTTQYLSDKGNNGKSTPLGNPYFCHTTLATSSPRLPATEADVM